MHEKLNCGILRSITLLRLEAMLLISMKLYISDEFNSYANEKFIQNVYIGRIIHIKNAIIIIFQWMLKNALNSLRYIVIRFLNLTLDTLHEKQIKK